MIGWIKRNIVIVVLAVLVVAALPAAWIFSNGWNTRIREGQEKEAQNLMNRLRGAKANYELPSFQLDGQPLSESVVPNERFTEWFAEQKQQVEADAQAAVVRAVEFNDRGMNVLKPELFPRPANQRVGNMHAVEMVQALVGDTGRSVYQQLLDEVDAGPPVESESLGRTLADLQQREQERLLAVTGESSLNEEQSAQIKATLINRRLAEYARRARELSFYAEESALTEPGPGVSINGVSIPPASVPANPPEVDQCFLWQFDLWVYRDILSAIARANANDAGEPVGIVNAPVKRLIALRLEPLVALDGPGGTGGGGPSRPPMNDPRDRGGWNDPGGSDPYGGGGAESTGDVSAPGGVAPLDLQRSITGRHTSDANQIYDVRIVELEVIASSSRLPRLFDALAGTNFMTVLDVDISEVDAWDELKNGYYFGSDHVVRAVLTIETLWLREWTVPLMPDGVADSLGVVKPQQQNG